MDYDVTFFNQAKWFQKGTNIALSRLRRSILRQKSRSARMFLWIALAETIRQTSNSRTSTYKLHARPKDDAVFTLEDVFTTYENTASASQGRLKSFSDTLKNHGFLKNGCYTRRAAITLGDSTEELPGHNGASSKDYHFVMTSPPYGDNRTTVPYGQAGWLPLQWIKADDIAPNYKAKTAECAYTIDGRSLGGSKGRRDLNKLSEELSDLSPSVKRTLARLAKHPKDGATRFVLFVYDLHKSMQQIANRCVDNAYLMWTLGHRKIRGVECPLTSIMSELFSHHGVQEVHRVHRRIHSKKNGNQKQHSQHDARRNHTYTAQITERFTSCVMPDNTQQSQNRGEVAEFHLDIDAQVVRQLGTELITDAEQALLELVKNSYDADAAWCNVLIESDSEHEILVPGKQNKIKLKGKISVEDAGSGMDRKSSPRWLAND